MSFRDGSRMFRAVLLVLPLLGVQGAAFEKPNWLQCSLFQTSNEATGAPVGLHISSDQSTGSTQFIASGRQHFKIFQGTVGTV